MARVSDNVLPKDSVIGMTLDRYAEILRLDTCAFNGLNRVTDNHDSQCIDIVRQDERDYLAEFLMQAKEMREEELGHYIYPTYRTEHQDVVVNNPFMLDMKHLIAVGMPTETTISAGVVIDTGTPPFDTTNTPTDPIVLSVATTVTDADEVIVKYPGEDVRIYPTSVSISGGIATITIPLCRLVKPEYNVNWDDPPSYYNDDVYLDTVDVLRLYMDVSNGADFVWNRNPCDANTACETVCQSACIVIAGHMANELSIVSAYPATHSAGVWTRACPTYSQSPNHLRVTYKSGITQSMRTEIDTIRLAHTLMPYPPCQCDIVKQRWEGDRDKLTTQWTRYGSYQGAIHVWMTDISKKSGQGGMFPRIGR